MGYSEMQCSSDSALQDCRSDNTAVHRHCSDKTTVRCTDTAVTRQDCRPAGQGGEQSEEDWRGLLRTVEGCRGLWRTLQDFRGL